jgi:hypothetical protein
MKYFLPVCVLISISFFLIVLGEALNTKPQGAAGPNKPFCACSDAGMQAIECRMANEPCDNR